LSASIGVAEPVHLPRQQLQLLLPTALLLSCYSDSRTSSVIQLNMLLSASMV
jgi:hypothetical protein